LLAAEKSGRSETSDADEAFMNIRNQLKRFTMLTEEGKKLLDIFMDVSSKKGDPPVNVSVLCS
jgi:hypothetical protein